MKHGSRLHPQSNVVHCRAIGKPWAVSLRQPHKSYRHTINSLNSLKGGLYIEDYIGFRVQGLESKLLTLYKGLYRRLLWGLLRGGYWECRLQLHINPDP